MQITETDRGSITRSGVFRIDPYSKREP